MSKNRQAKLSRLLGLSSTPDEQVNFAIDLLGENRDRQLVQEALRVLGEKPNSRARPALVDLYTYYDDKGGIRDGGGLLRMTIIKALRPVALPEDRKIFERACMTYEFIPPSYKEEAKSLRAAGLVALNDLDDSLASHHATRILAEPYTESMSGEPAMTAVRVLASQEQLLPIYYYVSQESAGLIPELLSESLRSLTSLPDTLIPGLLEKYSDAENEIVLAGLFDLLLTHDTGPHGRDFLLNFLKVTEQMDLYRYLTALIVAVSKQELLTDLLNIATYEQNRQKIPILIEVLELLDYLPEVEAVLAKLIKRIPTSR